MENLDNYLLQARKAREDQIASLKQALEQEESFKKELVSALSASKEREKQLNVALRALGGDKKKISQPSSKEKKQPWIPSQEKVDRVLAFVQEHGEVSISNVATSLHMSGVTVRRCLEVLREEEKVRISGRNARKGTTWAPMPGGN